MAIDYPTLFADIGSFITAINQIRDTAVQLNSPRPDLLSLEEDHQDALTKINSPDTVPPGTPPYTPRGRFGVLSGLDETYEGIKDLFIAQAEELASYITNRLLDPDTMIANLPGMGNGPSIERVLVELYNDMLINSQSVLESTVTIGSVTADANSGNGTAFLSKRLDGTSRPGANLESSVLYSGTDSEMVVTSEEILWTCTGDQFDQGATDGAESFQLESRPAAGSSFSWRPEGSGESIGITNFNGVGTELDNKDFDEWTDPSTPVGWDIEAGTVQQYLAPSTNVFRGAASLQFPAQGKISQAVTDLEPRRLYAATIAYKAQTNGTNLQFYFEGTLADGSNYVAQGEERLDISIGTAWTQSAIFYLVPGQPMVDGKLIVQAGGVVWIDSLTLGLPQWIGGVATCIVAGDKPWVTTDRLRVTISNDDAGKFQQFWRRYYGRQLPSSDTNSISEPAL
jgi:hypothetical protein